MKNHVITTTQLRGMIKEALEESIQEIAIDEQIAALRAKGSRRSLQETRQYRKLLEMKMEEMDELAMGDESGMESGMDSEIQQGALRTDVQRVLDALGRSPLLQKRLEKIDQPLEIHQLLGALALQMGGSEKEAARVLLKARSWLLGHTESTFGKQSTEQEAELLGTERSLMPESRRLARRR